MPRRREVLREVRLIVARRNGAVYRTRFKEFGWFPADSPAARLETVGDLMFCAPSSLYEGETMRTVTD